MAYISEIFTSPPSEFKTELQRMTYAALAELSIPFERVETEKIVTMEECAGVEKKLGMEMVKTLFLCNRQKTEFYLFITRGSKPFRSRDFDRALGVSRVSFAPPELMETMLGTEIGAATVFSLLLDGGRRVRAVFDEEVAAAEWYGCSDGTTTGYMKLPTRMVVGDFMKYTGHDPAIIKIQPQVPKGD